MRYTDCVRSRRLLPAACLVSALALPAFARQQPVDTPTVDAQPAPDQIRKELEQIKKGRTLALRAAEGMEDTDGNTVLRIDNASDFPIVILLVGPNTERIELGPARMQTLTLAPGDYEIAVRAVGRDVPPFYGRQTIVANMRFRHQFVLPAF